MEEASPAYECFDLEEIDADDTRRSPLLRIVRLEDFEAPFSLSEENRDAYLRRFATLLVDEVRTKEGGNASIVPASNAFGERFAVKTFHAPSAHEYDAHRLVSGIQGYPKLYGKAKINGNQALIMEWIEGEDVLRIRSRLAVDDDGRISPLTVARLGRDLFDALARTSVLEEQVTHVDLSLRNIMVSTLAQPLEEQVENGAFDVRIIDFGSAVIGDAEQSGDVSSGFGEGTCIAATPEYAAPELEAGECTPAADVFSASKILSELLYGQKDDMAHSVHATESDVNAVLTHEPEVAVIAAHAASSFSPAPTDGDIKAALQSVDGQLEEILSRGLEPDSKRRPSASEMRDLLASFSLQYATNIERALGGEELEPCNAPFEDKMIERLPLKARNIIRLVGKSLSFGLLASVVLITAFVIASVSATGIWGELSLEGASMQLLTASLLLVPIAGFMLRGKARYRVRDLARATLGILVACLFLAWVVNAGSVSPIAVKQLMSSAFFAVGVMTWCPLVLDCVFPPQAASVRKKRRRPLALLGGSAPERLLGDGEEHPSEEERS